MSERDTGNLSTKVERHTQNSLYLIVWYKEKTVAFVGSIGKSTVGPPHSHMGVGYVITKDEVGKPR